MFENVALEGQQLPQANQLQRPHPLGEDPPIKTPHEFAEVFHQSPVYGEMMEIVSNRDRLIPPELQLKDYSNQQTYVISTR